MIRRLLLALLVLVILGLGGGFLYLGLFPPVPHPVVVHKVVPTSKLGK